MSVQIPTRAAIAHHGLVVGHARSSSGTFLFGTRFGEFLSWTLLVGIAPRAGGARFHPAMTNSVLSGCSLELPPFTLSLDTRAELRVLFARSCRGRAWEDGFLSVSWGGVWGLGFGRNGRWLFAARRPEPPVPISPFQSSDLCRLRSLTRHNTLSLNNPLNETLDGTGKQD